MKVAGADGGQATRNMNKNELDESNPMAMGDAGTDGGRATREHQSATIRIEIRVIEYGDE